jgi:glutaredoxin 2
LTTVYKFQAPLNLAGDYKHAEDMAYGQQKYAVRGGGKYVMSEGDAEEPPKLATVADEATLLAEANESLKAFEAEVVPQLGGCDLDDVEVLPTLRNATCIPGLTWPAATRKYVEETCAKGGVPTYFASQDTA